MADDSQPPLDPINLGQAIGNNEAPNVGASNATPTLAKQPVQGQVAGGKLPLLGQLLADVIKPPMQMQAQPGQMATMRPASRANEFESFLGQFLFAMGQGMQSAGHGPGSFGRGFGGAMTAPYAQQQMQNNLQQQQAQIQSQQAEAQLRQTQAQQMGNMATLNIPGMGPVTAPVSQLGNILKGAPAAAISGQAKINAIEAQTRIMAGEVSKMIPDVDPKTGQQFYRLQNKFGREIGQTDANVIPQLMSRTSNTVDWKMNELTGQFEALPKTTVSGPNIPGVMGKPSGRPSGAVPISGVGAGGRQFKLPPMSQGTDPQGRMIAGTPQELQAAGASGITKMEAGDQSKVLVARQLVGPGGLFDLINQDISKFKPGELGVLNSRVKEFMAGQVGSGDPRFVDLRTHVDLLKTALMQAHVGSKGGEGFMEDFGNLANAKKMDSDTLSRAVAAEQKYVTEKAMRATPRNSSVDDLMKKYGGS